MPRVYNQVEKSTHLSGVLQLEPTQACNYCNSKTYSGSPWIWTTMWSCFFPELQCQIVSVYHNTKVEKSGYHFWLYWGYSKLLDVLCALYSTWSQDTFLTSSHLQWSTDANLILPLSLLWTYVEDCVMLCFIFTIPLSRYYQEGEIRRGGVRAELASSGYLWPVIQKEVIEGVRRFLVDSSWVLVEF